MFIAGGFKMSTVHLLLYACMRRCAALLQLVPQSNNLQTTVVTGRQHDYERQVAVSVHKGICPNSKLQAVLQHDR